MGDEEKSGDSGKGEPEEKKKLEEEKKEAEEKSGTEAKPEEQKAGETEKKEEEKGTSPERTSRQLEATPPPSSPPAACPPPEPATIAETAGEEKESESPPKDDEELRRERERLIESVPKIVAAKPPVKIYDEEYLTHKVRYQIFRERELATGSFAKFYRVKDREGKDQAMKCIVLSNTVPLKYKDQLNGLSLRIMRYLSGNPHPNICSIYELYQSPGKVYIFMELLTGGNLENYVKKNEVKEMIIKRYCRDMAEAMNFLWICGIAHQAIKTAHGVLTANKGQVKLVGFANAVVLWDVKSQQPLKQKKLQKEEWLPYLAPEVIKEDYDPVLADVWSFGCFIIALLTRRYPFDSKTKEYQKQWPIVCKRYEVTPSKELTDLLNRIFVEPHKRISVSKLLMQPWLNV